MEQSKDRKEDPPLFHNNMCIFEEFEFHSKYIDILGNPIDMFVFGLFLKEVVWIEDLSHFLVQNPVFATKNIEIN